MTDQHTPRTTSALGATSRDRAVTRITVALILAGVFGAWSVVLDRRHAPEGGRALGRLEPFHAICLWRRGPQPNMDLYFGAAIGSDDPPPGRIILSQIHIDPAVDPKDPSATSATSSPRDALGDGARAEHSHDS